MNKKAKNKPLAKVLHYDLYGKREDKYNFLNDNSLSSIKWNELENRKPELFFVKKDWETFVKYDKGFKVDDIFTVNNVGFTAARDSSLIYTNKVDVEMLLNDLEVLDIDELRKKYNFGTDSRDWTIKGAIEDIKSKKDKNITKINYRPFDFRYSHISKKVKGFFSYPRWEIMQHFYQKNNVGLVATRLNRQKSLSYFWVSKQILERHILDSAGDSTSFFPLYLYPDQQTDGIFKEQERTPNLNMEIVEQISTKLGITFTPEKDFSKNSSPPFKEEYPKGEEVKNAPDQSLNNLPHLKTFRRKLRNNLTPAEAKLWTLLKGSQLEGRKFRRQHSVANYILDFYCPSEKLAIELDGAVHNTKEAKEYDRERDLFLENFGIRVLRFENKLVFDETDFVLGSVSESFGWNKKTTTPNPSLQGGELLFESFAPIDLLDYIYGVLHSPSYREKYKEFLKIDFPRVPYPKNQKTFWQLVKFGGELRTIHLLENPIVEKSITTFPIDGSNIITRRLTKTDWEINTQENTNRQGDASPCKMIPCGKIWINDEQYFGDIPLIAWEFYIGGYQPAQKWLKDRRGRILNFEDIMHYQKIIVALTETDRLMKEIDKIKI